MKKIGELAKKALYWYLNQYAQCYYDYYKNTYRVL